LSRIQFTKVIFSHCCVCRFRFVKADCKHESTKEQSFFVKYLLRVVVPLCLRVCKFLPFQIKFGLYKKNICYLCNGFWKKTASECDLLIFHSKFSKKPAGFPVIRNSMEGMCGGIFAIEVKWKECAAEFSPLRLNGGKCAEEFPPLRLNGGKCAEEFSPLRLNDGKCAAEFPPLRLNDGKCAAESSPLRFNGRNARRNFRHRGSMERMRGGTRPDRDKA
jgi:hypothetical protein